MTGQKAVQRTAGGSPVSEDVGMPRIDDTTIPTVLDVYLPERVRLIELLGTLNAEQWSSPTECPAYSVKGIATHILGDDLSLLSRQRDGAVQGLVLIAERRCSATLRRISVRAGPYSRGSRRHFRACRYRA